MRLTPDLRPAARAAGAGAAATVMLLALASGAGAATVVSSGHIDLVEVECDGGDLELGTHLDTATGPVHVEPGDLGDYTFFVDAAETYDPVTGDYVLENSATIEGSLPFMGLAYDEEGECSGLSLPTLDVYLADASGDGDVQVIGGSTVELDSATPLTGSVTLTPGSHQHKEWRFTDLGDYSLTFWVDGGSLDPDQLTVHIQVG